MAAICLLLMMSGTAFAGEDISAEETPGIDYFVLVNKTHSLPEDWEEKVVLKESQNRYGETYLVEEKALESFYALQEELLEEGIIMELDSTYRSVEEQQQLWDEWMVEFGEDYVKRYVAVPGYSEHHTGLAIDICIEKDGVRINDNDEMIAEEEIFTKIHEHLAEHGFILRYLDGKEYITGYGYEPWHFRYIGDVDAAREIMSEGKTLEGYLGVVNEPEVEIDYGTSELYTQEELEEAALQVKCKFASFEGCELHSLRYAGDEANNEENLEWLNSFEGAGYTKVVEFLTDFHSPVEGIGAWNLDEEYRDYQWWLGWTEEDGWTLVSWGY